ncbi:hypothetical protein P170DRAFT_12108 [Aspergillus steynii IBT 23096]|uniref:Uncharacterized protein n=1 Tax=Aspergillus steynii IBT 23096 TaxID=1392250 RepID=A0A2I2GN33_9EURO|nr:uncharacterized protein P170DRAFT_12108 [Aspergillus steynii IBT 23096]PLB54276.1 hypothetical protein P170DRAFT_12108 [Aspergillus steynii IBT 23096]
MHDEADGRKMEGNWRMKEGGRGESRRGRRRRRRRGEREIKKKGKARKIKPIKKRAGQNKECRGIIYLLLIIYSASWEISGTLSFVEARTSHFKSGTTAFISWSRNELDEWTMSYQLARPGGEGIPNPSMAASWANTA